MIGISWLSETSQHIHKRPAAKSEHAESSAFILEIVFDILTVCLQTISSVKR